MSLTIQHEEQDGTRAVIRLIGRLQLGPGCVELEHLVADLMARGFRHLTFEIAGVTHVDSTGMGRFVDAYSKLKRLDGDIRIMGATGAVRDMFKVTRLDTVIPVD